MDLRKDPEVYGFLRFVFGGCYCPFCTQFTWQKHAEIHQEAYPLEANAVMKHSFVDGPMPSPESVEKAMQNPTTTDRYGRQSWVLSEEIGVKRYRGVSRRSKEDRAFEVDLEKNQLPVTKTLSVSWTACDD